MVTSSHTFFCEGPYCNVMTFTLGSLCEFCIHDQNEIIKIKNDINSIKEKLFTKMIQDQRCDWLDILRRKQSKLNDMEQSYRNTVNSQL